MIETARSPGENARIYELASVDWADWSPDGTLLFGRDGRLYRQQVPRSLADTLAPPGIVADLTNQSFEHILAPEKAYQWPARACGPAGKSKRRK